MKNYLLYVMLVFTLLGCGKQKYVHNSTLYKDIYVCQGDQNIFGKSLNLYRKQLNYLNKFEYSPKNDTVYILEMCGVQGDVLITIWNKNKMLSYTNEQGSFVSKDEALFTKYIMKLVSEWNIPEIRKKEASSNILPNELIYATKIVFNKEEYKIDCICFKDFYDIE